MLPGITPALFGGRSGGIDGFTKLMLHFDGADNGTVFTDSSQFNKPVKYYATYRTWVVQKKFGTASGHVQAANDCLYIDNGTDNDFAFGTGDFTIDVWARPDSSSVGIIYDARPNATDGVYPMLYITASNTLVYHVNSAVRITGTATLTLNVWHHIALVRSAGVTKLYVNGTQDGANYTDSNNYLVGLQRPVISNSGFNQLNMFTGFLDEMRVSKGIARWTANFIPPTSAYF